MRLLAEHGMLTIGGADEENDDPLAEVTAKITALEGKAATALEKLDAADLDPEGRKALREELDGFKAEHDELVRERKERIAEHEQKAMREEITTLRGALDELRKPTEFKFSGGVPTGGTGEQVYGEDSEYSFYADVKAARAGDTSARDRLLQSSGLEGKAMTEGTGSAGGYLVPPEISRDVLELRFQRSILRPLFSSISVSSNQLELTQVTGGLLAGWVAELATKPSADFTFGQLITNVYTAAGLAVVANQLIQDSVTSVDALVNADIAARLAILEEVAFIGGTGSGQPTGILNTSGVNTVALTSTAVVDLLDAITDAITAIWTNYFAPPNAIVMHPRTWARIVKARESASPTTYIVGSPGSNNIGRRPQDALPGYSAGQTPRGELFGLPVYTTANVPTNRGAGTNQSCVIVGAFDQGLILDRQGVQTDLSEHVYFTSNQTVFRSEERLGFTAARYPKAFSVVDGAGLADG